MAITSVRLRNFRCFADSRVVPLAPLTVVFGRNNSGKSSILLSLLLLRQTLDNPEYGARLNLRGPLYAAGTYSDIVHQHQLTQHIAMEFELADEESGLAAELTLEFLSNEPQPPQLARLRVTAKGVLPLEIRRGQGRGGPFGMRIGSDVLGGDRDANFTFPVNQFLPLIGAEPRRVGRPNARRETSRENAREVIEHFRNALLDVRAVGAFRREPSRRYEYHGRAPEVVDLRGEYVVNALIEDSTRRGKQKGTLLKSVNEWLGRVGRVRLMPLKRISASARLYELRLRDLDSGRWANFADVGFGIGQALPVIVEGLRTDEDGTFIVQEPEIHLHPDAQMAMADFLISLVETGRRVIVETHSEAILLRIRREVIKKRGAGVLDPDQVSVIHVASSRQGTSRTRSLTVDELGQIKGWPAGFMEEVTKERMAMLKDMTGRAGAK